MPVADIAVPPIVTGGVRSIASDVGGSFHIAHAETMTA